MIRKRPSGRYTPNKENIADPLLKEARARQKLHTLSQDNNESVNQQQKLEFSGWFNDTALIERVNKVKRKKSLLSKRQEVMRVSASKIILELRKKNGMDELDAKFGIELLKKEAEYLEADNPEDIMEPPRVKSRFPKKEDLMTSTTHNPHRIEKTLQFDEDVTPAPIQNNYFCSREKYSAIEQNRKKIKGIKKLSVGESSMLVAANNNQATNTSLKCSLNNIEVMYREMRLQQQRPYSSFVRKSDRVHSQKTGTDRLNLTTTSNQQQPPQSEEKKFNGTTIYRNRYIHEGFKRCRMHKRNRSARLSFCQAASIPNKYSQLIQGSKIKQQSINEQISVDL